MVKIYRTPPRSKIMAMPMPTHLPAYGPAHTVFRNGRLVSCLDMGGSGHSTPSGEVIRKPEGQNVSQRRRRQRRTDQVTATDNIRNKFGEGWMCGCGDTFADRQTDRHTCSSQYSATPSGCGVINRKCCTESGNGVICNCIPARFPL